MNTKQIARIALVIVPFFAVLTGCYTQVESVRDTQYYEEYDSTEADTTDSYSNEPYYDNGYGWYPNYHLGFSYYYPSYYGDPFYSSWYSPWYYFPYSFYGYYHYPYYYGHGFGGSYGTRRDTRKFGHTRTGASRQGITTNSGSFYRSDALGGNRVRAGSAMRRSASRNSFGVSPRFNARQSYARGRSVSPRSNSYSRPPSYRPSRPSYSSPRSGGYRGGGFGGGARGGGGSHGGGSRGGGSRGGHR